LSEWARVLESREEKEVGIILECDVVFSVRTFVDAQIDNWRRIYRTSIGRCYSESVPVS
jgi:hypothetical protein